MSTSPPVVTLHDDTNVVEVRMEMSAECARRFPAMLAQLVANHKSSMCTTACSDSDTERTLTDAISSVYCDNGQSSTETAKAVEEPRWTQTQCDDDTGTAPMEVESTGALDTGTTNTPSSVDTHAATAAVPTISTMLRPPPLPTLTASGSVYAAAAYSAKARGATGVSALPVSLYCDHELMRADADPSAQAHVQQAIAVDGARRLYDAKAACQQHDHSAAMPLAQSHSVDVDRHGDSFYVDEQMRLYAGGDHFPPATHNHSHTAL